MEIALLAELPGREACRPDSKNARLEEAPRPGEAWAKLAGPYLLEGDSLETMLERDCLLGLVWDLEGEPIAPGGPRRPRANWIAVAEPGGTMVYRDACEMSRRANADDEAQEEASRMRGALPDRRSGLRKGVAA
jgi:hypothetical protein